jgi:hypothetical protein
MKDPGRAFRRLDEEGRRLASDAYHLWRDLAPKRGNPYGDHEYCLRAGRQAVDATRWEDGLVILKAIELYMDASSSPVRIPEWARTLGAERREEARKLEVQREREREAHEPISAETRALIEQTRARMKMPGRGIAGCDTQGCRGEAISGIGLCAGCARRAGRLVPAH